MGDMRPVPHVVESKRPLTSPTPSPQHPQAEASLSLFPPLPPALRGCCEMFFSDCKGNFQGGWDEGGGRCQQRAVRGRGSRGSQNGPQDRQGVSSPRPTQRRLPAPGRIPGARIRVEKGAARHQARRATQRGKAPSAACGASPRGPLRRRLGQADSGRRLGCPSTLPVCQQPAPGPSPSSAASRGRPAAPSQPPDTATSGVTRVRLACRAGAPLGRPAEKSPRPCCPPSSTDPPQQDASVPAGTVPPRSPSTSSFPASWSRGCGRLGFRRGAAGLGGASWPQHLLPLRRSRTPAQVEASQGLTGHADHAGARRREKGGQHTFCLYFAS